MSTFAEFDGLALRATTEADKPMLEAWIKQDAAHAGEFDPEYFIGSEGCFAIEDGHGVVFFIRLAQAARVRIQFNSTSDGMRQRTRVARALARGMAILEVGLSRAGVTEWVFDTANDDLKKYAIEGLGFRLSTDDLVRQIAQLEREAAQEEVA